MNAHLPRPLVLTAFALLFCLAATLRIALPPARAADPPAADLKSELPRVPPVEPNNAVATFKVQPGYQVELIAAEPLVTDPVAMSFDAAGRLFVAEMIDYSEDAEANLGCIRLLTDTDGDGRFDRSSLYAETLSWPTAVICYDGGVFVGAAPDIWFFKDTDGDGVADLKKKIYTGFGRSNVQGLINSFAWGLDNRIHGATSSSGGTIRRVDEESATAGRANESRLKGVSLSGRDFAFDPRSLELQATSGGAQHGLCFDNWGRKFVCSNSDHIQQVMFEDRYVARNPFLAAPSPRLSIAADGPQAEVYRISPVESWRIVRTRLRMSGQAPGPIEGGGRASGYFTSATGVTIYRGNAWPAAKTDDPKSTGPAEIAIVGDVGSNLIHRKLVVPHGVELIATRIDKESEFIASRDLWFRPVQYANSPDGSLTVADMYREVIEHPLSLPPAIKQHLDLTSGRDRGRIYRVVQDGFQQPKLPNLAEATTDELVATLAHANGWHRDTAARLLFERQDKSAAPALARLATSGPRPEGRMHALYALPGVNALSSDVLLAALADKHPAVRRHAVRLSEGLVKDSPKLQDRWFALARDEADSEVRYQLLFSLGEITSEKRDAALAALARRGADNRWMRLALLSSLADGVERVFAQLADDATFRRTDGGAAVLTALAAQAGASGREADVARVLATVETLSSGEAGLAGQLVRGLGEGAARRGGSLEKLLATDATGKARKMLDQLIAAARQTATDVNGKPADRAAAVSVLALGPADDALPILRGLVDHRQPQDVQAAALAALAKRTDAGVAAILLEAWPTLSPRMRSQATEALFARTDRLQALLDALEAGSFKPADVEPARVGQLQNHADAKIRERAGRLLASVKLGRRQDVVAAHRDVLEMKGDPQRGKEQFKKVCAACHRVEGVGYEIGANLVTFKNRGAEAILTNVLDPNREVNPQYVNYALITDDGRTITGMVDSETANSVTLKRAEGATDTVLRANIEQLVATGLSIMPEGLEQQLDKQALADLLAYLMNVQ